MVKTTRRKLYHGYETRLETYNGAKLQGSKPRSRKVSWPHARPTAAQLAKAGFYFTPAPTEFGGDLVTCYMCGSGIDGWEPEDDPIKVHSENCTSCPLAIIQSKPWESDEEHDPFSELVLSSRLQTYYQPMTTEELEEVIVNSTAEISENASPSKAALLSVSTLQLMGTSVWPHDSKKGWTPTSERMARAGFFYSPNQTGEDYGLCPYCNLGLDGWEPNDDPMLEHQRRSPGCIFFRSLPVSEIPKTAAEHSTIEFSDSDAGNDSSASVTSTTSQRKKARKRTSKRTSTNSDYSDSGMSTTSTTKVKRKRGRPPKNSVIESSSAADTKEKKKARLSAFEDDGLLFADAKSKANTTTSENLLSPSILRSGQVSSSKSSVLDKISKFEGFAQTTEPVKVSKQIKVSTSSSKSKLFKNSDVSDSTKTRSFKDIEMEHHFDSSDEDSLLPMKSPEPRPVKSSKISSKSKAQDTSKPKLQPKSPVSVEASPLISHPAPASPWLSKPQSPPQIFQDAEEEMSEVETSTKVKPPARQVPLNKALPAPPKMPLHDSSPQVRNATPPPVSYIGDEPALPKPSNTPVKQISPQLASPPNPHQHASHTGWAAIDTDMVFDLLESAGDDGGRLLTGISDSATASSHDPIVGEQHLDKTVKEWIDSVAIEGEQRLKAKCEALIAILEQESKLAISALEALPVRR